MSNKKQDLDEMTLPWLNNISGSNKSYQKCRIAIIGDIIIDEYLEGEVSRISPEAPVPIHLVKSVHRTAGGAANVARNIKLAGGEPLLFGVSGNDEAGRQLLEILAADSIITSNILISQQRPTISKCRVSSDHQQLLRIDREDRSPINAAEQKQIMQLLKQQEFDLILISDYAKGTLPKELLKEIFSYAKQKGVRTIVDPKGSDFSKYSGASLITPNFKEAVEALGISSTSSWSGEYLGRSLQEKFALEDVLVTLGARGMVLVPHSSKEKDPIKGKIIEQPTVAREVYDVAGAGDTVVAIMALAVAADADNAFAVKLANMAAGVVVEKWGVKAITLDELQKALYRSKHIQDTKKVTSKDKILEKSSLETILATLRSSGKKIVFTNGCFDILHAGHISYLENASACGDILIIGVNSDTSIQRLKGPSRPIVQLSERLQLLAALACVDYVTSFDEDTPAALIDKIKPDVLVKGADWSLDKIIGSDSVQKSGGEVRRIPLVEGLSTSAIIQKIKAEKL